MRRHYLDITMVMETIQIRLTKRLVEELDKMIKEGFYPNKSEAVRDAVRRLILEQELGELGEELEEMEEGGEGIRGGRKGKEEVAEHVRELRKYCH